MLALTLKILGYFLFVSLSYIVPLCQFVLFQLLYLQISFLPLHAFLPLYSRQEHFSLK